MPKLKIAHVIGKAVWEHRGDIRDVISIGKLVRKDEGPKEIASILATMTKYGETASRKSSVNGSKIIDSAVVGPCTQESGKFMYLICAKLDPSLLNNGAVVNSLLLSDKAVVKNLLLNDKSVLKSLLMNNATALK